MESFAVRLQQAVQDQFQSSSPTLLAREFNLRWRGAPVTVAAVRKWMSGGSLPTLDKLNLLATMLNVSGDWLRWGVGKQHLVQEPFALYAGEDQVISFLQDFSLLTEGNQSLLLGILHLMLSQQQAQKSPA